LEPIDFNNVEPFILPFPFTSVLPLGETGTLPPAVGEVPKRPFCGEPSSPPMKPSPPPPFPGGEEDREGVRGPWRGFGARGDSSGGSWGPEVAAGAGRCCLMVVWKAEMNSSRWGSFWN